VAILAEERGVRVRVETPEEMCMLGDAGGAAHVAGEPARTASIGKIVRRFDTRGLYG
jgi:hypothetical protein